MMVGQARTLEAPRQGDGWVFLDWKEPVDGGKVAAYRRSMWDRLSSLSFDRLVLGNVHAAPGRTRITDSVYLSQDEIDTLARFRLNGGRVEIQTFPGERLQLEIDNNGDPKWSRR